MSTPRVADKSLNVSVIDTGVTHGESCGPARTRFGYSPVDTRDEGQGTHVAGVIVVGTPPKK